MAREFAISSEALASAFSTAVFKELGRETPDYAIFGRIRCVASLGAENGLTLAQAFDAAHSQLSSDYRNEYIFKNELVTKLIFGKHSPRTATALLELRMGHSWADLVVVNGTSTTYEVKTDLDQFGRLSSQVADYSRRSEFVNVVTSERRAHSAESILPSHVGVIALKRNGSLATIRKSESNLERLEASDLYSLLRAAEAENVLKRLIGYELDVSAGHAWKRMREVFSEISGASAHSEVVRQLKLRGRDAANLVTRSGFPSSLRGLAYATPFSSTGRERLLERLDSPSTLVLEAC